MRRVIGRFAQIAVLTVAALIIGRFGYTLRSALASERGASFSVGVAQAQREKQGMDVASVRAVLDAARGVNTVACQLAAVTVDGRSWSSSDFMAGGSVDSIARDVATRVHHDVDAAAVPLLRTAISDADWCVRRLAAPMLARVHDASAVQAMIGALGASDAATREMGAFALGFAEDTSTITLLVARLRDESPRVRATVAWALGEIEGPRAVRPLIDALGDSDATVRESVAQALGELEDTTAIRPLTDRLATDREASVRRAAARALGEIIG